MLYCFPCKKKEEDVVKYSELSVINTNTDIKSYTALQISIIQGIRLRCCTKNKEIQLECDSIKINNLQVKYEYIIAFYFRSPLEICIKVLGQITRENEVEISDTSFLIVIKFTSIRKKDEFIEEIIKQIKKYKLYNTYDKSVIQYKAFRK